MVETSGRRIEEVGAEGRSPEVFSLYLLKHTRETDGAVKDAKK